MWRRRFPRGARRTRLQGGDGNQQHGLILFVAS
uniref:Uncharacterized protein n=1 Tax=Arundo donax TaxID=35708 RepID=A0A0A9CAW9_ARUDO